MKTKNKMQNVEPRHEDLLTHGLPDNYKVCSAKIITETLANPHLVLYNSSVFKGTVLSAAQSFNECTLISDDKPQMEHITNGHVNGNGMSVEKQCQWKGNVNGSNGKNGNVNGTNGTNGHSKWTSFGEHKIRLFYAFNFLLQDKANLSEKTRCRNVYEGSLFEQSR